jgi:Na+/glutamate symporter
MPFKLGLVVATVVGISIGIFLDSRNNKRPRSHKEEEMSQISSHAEPPMATQGKHTEKGEE